MILLDVNVLVYAHRVESPRHHEYRSWLEAEVDAGAPYGLSGIVLSGFLRVITHPRIFDVPTPPDTAIAAAASLRNRPNAVPVEPGPGHWGIFERLCRESGARGNLVPDRGVTLRPIG